MKLVLLMYLQEDEACVERFLAELEVQTFSRLRMEGRGPGAPVGWTGETLPYESEMVVSVLPDEQARALMDAVTTCTGVQDPARHPVRAALIDVEEFTSSPLAGG